MKIDDNNLKDPFFSIFVFHDHCFQNLGKKNQRLLKSTTAKRVLHLRLHETIN